MHARIAPVLLVSLSLFGCSKLLGPSEKQRECQAFLDAANTDGAAVIAFEKATGDFVDPKVTAAALKAMDRQVDAVSALSLKDATLTALKPRYVATRKSQRTALATYEDASAKLSVPTWVPPEGFSEALSKSAKEADDASKAYQTLINDVKTTCNIR